MRSFAARRHRFAPLAVLLLALFLTGAAYAWLAPARNASAAGLSAADASAPEGQRLFLSNCASCHGMNAEGGSEGPSLVGVGSAAVHFQVETGRMPLAQPGPQAPKSRRKFDDQQVADLAAYIASLAPGPATPSQDQLDYQTGDAAVGGEIFRTNCAMCHNYAGSGGALTQGKYAPSLRGVDPKHIYEAMLTGPQNMPVFNDNQISADHKKDVIAYLKSLESDPTPVRSIGSVGPVSEGLVGWILGIGLLVVSASWLTQKAK